MAAVAAYPMAVEGRVVGVVAAVARQPLAATALADLGRAAEGVAQYIDRRRAEGQIKEGEDRYRQLFDESPLPTWVYDRQSLAFLEVNNAALVKYGYSRSEFLARTVKDIRPEQEVPAWATVQATDEGPDPSSVWAHSLKDGSTIRVRVRTHNLKYQGRPARLVQALDVTDQLRAEEQLQASEQRFRHAFDDSGSGMALVATDGRFLRVNPALCAILGYPEAELLATTCVEVTPPSDREADKDWVEPMLAGRLPTHSLEKRYVRRDGQVVWSRLTISIVRDADGRPSYFVAQFQDVTARRAAEAELHLSENRYRSLVAAMAEGVVMQTADAAIVTCNASAERILGRTADEICGRTSHHPSWRAVREDGTPLPAEMHPALVTLRTGLPCTNSVMGVHKPDGALSWILVNAGPLTRPGESAPYGVVTSFADITAQKAAADALAASTRLYALLADHGQDAIMMLEGDGSVSYASPSTEAATGHPSGEVLAAGFWSLVHPDDLPAARASGEACLAGRPSTVEWRCLRPGGRDLWMETAFTPVAGAARVVASSRDITARKALEDQVRQSQKLEAIGQLASGVAHDFNNLLTVVNGCGELLLEGLTPSDPARLLVEDIVKAGERGAALTRQLLAFSRQQILRPEAFDPNRVVNDTLKMLARLLGEDVTLRTALDPAVGWVKADIGQLEQVVINLAVNARYAMPRGGTLTIGTSPAVVAAAAPRPSPDARPGVYVRLSVTDTGTGMPPEVLARIFEPFFTTKPLGQGTGLGLATAYGIVRQSGGFVTVSSAVGAGTVVSVHLPRLLDEDKDEAPPKSSCRPAHRSSGHESVVVVEDDETVRHVTAAVLRRRGYRVEVASTGAEALAVCRRLESSPDLLVTDVVMPGMGGRELAEALATQYPRLRVLFLSGYTSDAVLRHGIEEARVLFLQKPFSANALAQSVREALDSEAWAVGRNSD